MIPNAYKPNKISLAMAFKYVIKSFHPGPFSLLRAKRYLPTGYTFKRGMLNEVTISLNSEMDYSTLACLESMNMTSVRKIRTF